MDKKGIIYLSCNMGRAVLAVNINKNHNFLRVTYKEIFFEGGMDLK